MPTTVVIQEGETVSQIASRNGFQNWHLVWDDPGNDSLRNHRKKPEMEQPDDKLVIPDRKAAKIKAPPGSKVGGQLTSAPPLAVIEIGLFDRNIASAPLAGFKVSLRLPGDGSVHDYIVPSGGVVRIEGDLVAKGEVQLFDMTDETASPSISYADRCGQMLSTGQSHVVEIPNKRTVADAIASAQGMVRRSGWGARPPKKQLEPDWDYEWIVIHHSGDSGYKTAKEILDVQMDERGFDDIAYEYVVKLDGTLWEGRHISFKSAGNSNMNTGKIAIIVAGDFEHQTLDIDDDVTQASLDRVVSLVNTLKQHFPLAKLVGHRDLVPGRTQCPGSQLYSRLAELRTGTGLAGP